MERFKMILAGPFPRLLTDAERAEVVRRASDAIASKVDTFLKRESLTTGQKATFSYVIHFDEESQAEADRSEIRGG